MTIPVAIKYKAIVHYKHFGGSIRSVSRVHSVTKSSLHRWVRQDDEASTIFKERTRRKRASAFSVVRKTLENAISKNPFVNLETLSREINERCGLKRSRTSVFRYLKQSGYSLKKAFRKVKVDNDQERVTDFCTKHLAARDDDILYVDEACFYIGDHPRRGYSKRGSKLSISMERSCVRRKYTILLAIGKGGVVRHELFKGSCNKERFVSFVQTLPPGKKIVMDNVAFHKSKETMFQLEKRRLEPMFIPPYSPDHNAIENVFGVLKTRFRSLCPPSIQNDFDYVRTMHSVIENASTEDFSRFFDRAKRFSEERLSSQLT